MTINIIINKKEWNEKASKYLISYFLAEEDFKLENILQKCSKINSKISVIRKKEEKKRKDEHEDGL